MKAKNLENFVKTDLDSDNESIIDMFSIFLFSWYTKNTRVGFSTHTGLFLTLNMFKKSFKNTVKN